MEYIRRIKYRLSVLWGNLFYTFEERTDSVYLESNKTLLQKADKNNQKYDALSLQFEDQMAAMKSELFSNFVNQLQQHLGYAQDSLSEELKDIYKNLILAHSTQLEKQDELKQVLIGLGDQLLWIQDKEIVNQDEVRDVKEKIGIALGKIDYFREEGIPHIIQNVKEVIGQVNNRIEAFDEDLSKFNEKREFHISTNDFAKYIVNAALDKDWENSEITLVNTTTESIGSMNPNIVKIGK